MHFQRITLVHYHELGLKGHNRATFEKRLMRNLEVLLEDAPVHEITRISGRVLVVYDAAAGADAPAKAAQLIARVPGVARVSCGFASERNMDDICEAAHQALGEAGDFCTWKVVGRRNHTDFPIDSMQINQIVGEHLCGLFPDKKVKMKGADVEVHVEVVQGMAYVYAQTMRGVGGLPVGTAGKVVCLLSSGIDSPVAMWRMARRGATCIAVHFSGRPQTASTSEYLSDDICRVLEEFGGVARMYVVPFGDYQREIAMRVPPALRIVIYRRFMMRIAERIARREGAKALVTGESLGQVASQTLDNLAATSDSVKMQITSVRLSAATSSRLSKTPKSSARSRFRAKMRPTAARCLCRARPRRTRSCAMYMTRKPICLSTSGPMKSWTRSRCTITVAPNRISVRRRRKTSSPHSGRCVLPDGQ